MGHNYSVKSITYKDGRHTNGVKTVYHYAGRCYDQKLSCPQADTDPDREYGNIGGYNIVEAITYDYDGVTPLTRRYSAYFQDLEKFGKLSWQEFGGYTGGVYSQLQRTHTTYQNLTLEGGARFVTADEVRNYTYGGSLEVSTKTKYFYDVNYQTDADGQNKQYGQLTAVQEFASADAGSPYRTTRTWYRINHKNGHWIMTPISQGIYHDAGWNLVVASWNYYDGGAYGGFPTQGRLTRSRQLLPNEIYCNDVPGGGGPGCNVAYLTLEARHTYDNYGNVTQTTSYSDYGYQTQDTVAPNFNLRDVPPTAARTTTITYENQFNLYPVKVRNSLEQETKFEIYGFRNAAGTLVPLNGFQKQAGLLKQVAEPNNVTTVYEYDPFGRLFAVYESVADQGNLENQWDGNPVKRYRYWDNAWNSSNVWLNPAGNTPFFISEHSRPDVYTPASGYALQTVRYFDGFGRAIQEQTKWAEVEGSTGRQDIVVSTSYNAGGQAACVTAPYNVTNVPLPGNGFANHACTNRERTTTTYDALGRPLIVTAPDGSTTRHVYTITDNTTVNGVSRLQRTQIYDALNRVTNYLYDSRGQLVKVRENTGTSPYTAYADTEYNYDLMGNLLRVRTQEPTQNGSGTVLRQTTMSYDDFGRKTGMNDADMGQWYYRYDAAGNLVRQKDAKGQQICFAYDSLDRLTRKAQDSNPATNCPTTLPGSGPYHLASYTYYASGNGQAGQLQTVSWGPNPAQNRDTFIYDTRGRMYRQNRLLDNRTYSMETTEFDALDRPLKVKYPTGEIVEMVYDREGENRMRAGTNWLVDDVRYNGRGQMTFLDRPDVSNTAFYYYGATGSNGNNNFRLQEIRHGATNDNKPDFTYTYDRVGNVFGMVARTTAGGINYTDTQSFGYDSFNRLTSASAAGGLANYSHVYDYNRIGNITRRREVNNGVTTEYNYAYPLGSNPVRPHAVTAITAAGQPSQSFSYDANGNMTRRVEGSTTYTHIFDVENRLVQVTKTGQGSTIFTYDAAGQRVKTLKPDGTAIYTPFPNYEEEVRPTILYRTSFETGGEINEVKSSAFPGTSVWRGTWGTTAPISGDFAYAISNQAYGYIRSDPITVAANTQYDLYAWVRGRLDPEDSNGSWIIRAYYYNSSGGAISYQDIASGGPTSVSTTWQERGGRITTPANIATLRIQLYNYMNSGWVAFDDVRLNPIGSGTNLVANPVFESSSNWSGITHSAFPGTSIWRSTQATAAPRSGSYAYAISNHAYGRLRSGAITVQAGAQYDLYAWMRGGIDADESVPSWSSWSLRLQFYDSSGNYIKYENAASGGPGSVNGGWQKKGGRVTAPAGAATVYIDLLSHFNTGWVAFDDIEFIRVGTSTNLAPDASFENNNGWTAHPMAQFPATSIWRSTWGSGGPRTGSFGYAISNHAYGYLQSNPIAVQPNTQYDLYAWVRGEIDLDDSASRWYIRLNFYNSSGGSLGYTDAASSNASNLTWQYRGGRVTTPANAATVQVALINHLNSGWVAFDDVMLTAVTTSTATIRCSSYSLPGQRIAVRVMVLAP
jgi:YD repeat-containing protein